MTRALCFLIAFFCLAARGHADSSRGMFGKTAFSAGVQYGGHTALIASGGIYYVADSNLSLGLKANITDSRVLYADIGSLIGYTFQPGAGMQIGLLSGIAFATANCYACKGDEGRSRPMGVPLDGHLLFHTPSAPFAAFGLNLTGFIAREVQTLGLGLAIALGKVGDRK